MVGSVAFGQARTSNDGSNCLDGMRLARTLCVSGMARRSLATQPSRT